MRYTAGLGIAVLLAGLLAGGCRKEDDTPKYEVIEGRVKSIDTQTQQVSMVAYNERKKKEMTFEGKLAPDAEILINGRTARPEDIMIDEKVKVTGRAEKRDGLLQLIAVKVEVLRAEDTVSTQPSESTPGGQ
jgi:hypothetical protein